MNIYDVIFKWISCDFRLRKDFKRLLEEIGCVTPGKSLNELRVLFLGRECFENLPENEVQEIYDLHQRELIQRSKKNFQVGNKFCLSIFSIARELQLKWDILYAPLHFHFCRNCFLKERICSTNFVLVRLEQSHKRIFLTFPMHFKRIQGNLKKFWNSVY